MLLGGLALALGAGLGGSQAKTDQAVGFPRAAVPGSLALRVVQPDTYVVYAEGTVCLDYPNCHGQLYPVSVRVTDPAGKAVEVVATDGPTYMIGGSEGTGVARFDATTPGLYRVAASTGAYAEGMIAVGRAFPAWTGDWVAWSVMGLLWVVGGLVIFVPVARYERRARSGQGGPLPMA